MKCPRCKSLLIVVDFHDIELDWCPACEGLWFDSGEMELVTATMRGTAAAPTPQQKANTSEKRLRCPECNKAMDKRLLGDAQPVIADVCPACGGLWLDHGELEQLVNAGGAALDASPVINHLRGTFSNVGGNAPGPAHSTGEARK